MSVRQFAQRYSRFSVQYPAFVLLWMGVLSVSLLACSHSRETTEVSSGDGFTLEQAAELAENLEAAQVDERNHTIKVTFGAGLLFDFDSATLRPEAHTHLSNLARSLRENGNTHVVIVGHADSVGTDAYNLKLSEERAAAAARVLTEEGVAPDRVESEGRGETEPVADNSTEDGRQRNRRVEVIISVTPGGSESDTDTTILW